MTRVPRVQRHARHGAERGGLNNITAVYWWPVPDGVGSPTFDCEAIAGTFTREYCEIDRFEACAVDAQCPIGDGASDCDPDAQHALIDFAKCFECDDGCDEDDGEGDLDCFFLAAQRAAAPRPEIRPG